MHSNNLHSIQPILIFEQYYFYLYNMRCNNFILLALAASFDLVLAIPARRQPSSGFLERRDIDALFIPQFIYHDGKESKSEITDLILLPNGDVVSRYDPGWKTAKAEAM